MYARPKTPRPVVAQPTRWRGPESYRADEFIAALSKALAEATDIEQLFAHLGAQCRDGAGHQPATNRFHAGNQESMKCPCRPLSWPDLPSPCTSLRGAHESSLVRPLLERNTGS